MSDEYREDDDLDREINQLFFKDDQDPLDQELNAHFAGEITQKPSFASTINQAAFTLQPSNAGFFTVKDNNISPNFGSASVELAKEWEKRQKKELELAQQNYDTTAPQQTQDVWNEMNKNNKLVVGHSEAIISIDDTNKLIWMKQGDKITTSKLCDNLTLIQSDEPPQILYFPEDNHEKPGTEHTAFSKEHGIPQIASKKSRTFRIWDILFWSIMTTATAVTIYLMNS